MTVKHLRSLQKQKVTAASVNDPNVMARYKLGYSECVQECIRFMNSNNNGVKQMDQMDQVTRQHLISNLVKQFHNGQQATQNNIQQETTKEQIEDNVDLQSMMSQINSEMAYRRSSISPIRGTSDNYYNLNNSSSSSLSCNENQTSASCESFSEQNSLPCSPKSNLESETAAADKDNCWRPW